MRSMLACLMAVALLLAANGSRAQDTQARAESVKAAFLYHFGGYVEWPEQAAAPAAMTIGVVGDDAVVAELEQLLPRRTLKNLPVKVRALKAGADLRDVQILFIGRNAAAPQALARTAQQLPILIITDQPDGLDSGGMINFVMAERRVRFEISRPAAEKSGLRFSSRLLAVALRVKSSGLFNSNPLVPMNS